MSDDLTGLLRLTGTVLAAALAGLAVLGLSGRPASLIRRARRCGPTRTASAAPPSETGGLPAWAAAGRMILRPRPDAPARSARVAAATGAGVASVALALLSRAGGPTALLSGVLAGLIGLVVVGKLESPSARRRRHRMVVELPHLLDLLAACLRAGLPLRAAARAVLGVSDGPLADDLGLVVAQIELGVAEADAWRSLRGHPVLGRLAVDLARSVESGTRIVETLRQHAEDARRLRRGALEARAKTVGVHSVPPLMVCFLPAFLLIGVVPTGVSAFLHALG